MAYIVFDKNTKLYKIGKSKDVKKRLQTLSTSNLNLKLILVLNYTKEKLLHQIYKDKRIAKEWYSLRPSDIEDIKELEFENKLNFS